MDTPPSFVIAALALLFVGQKVTKSPVLSPWLHAILNRRKQKPANSPLCLSFFYDFTLSTNRKPTWTVLGSDSAGFFTLSPVQNRCHGEGTHGDSVERVFMSVGKISLMRYIAVSCPSKWQGIPSDLISNQQFWFSSEASFASAASRCSSDV